MACWLIMLTVQTTSYDMLEIVSREAYFPISSSDIRKRRAID
jgi:hypothetical protein